MNPMHENYPNLALNEKHGEAIQMILDYFEENGLTVVEAEPLYEAEIFVPYIQTTRKQLFEAVGIDVNELERERSAMLTELIN